MKLFGKALGTMAAVAVIVVLMGGTAYAAGWNSVTVNCNSTPTRSTQLRHVTTANDYIQVSVTSNLPAGLHWEVVNGNPKSKTYLQAFGGPIQIKAAKTEYVIADDVLIGTEFYNEVWCSGSAIETAPALEYY